VALLEFLLAAAGAGIVAAHFLQRVSHRLLVAVIAVRAMHMVVVIVVMVVIAVGTMYVGFLTHEGTTPG
jgi:hypothetical protein